MTYWHLRSGEASGQIPERPAVAFETPHVDQTDFLSLPEVVPATGGQNVTRTFSHERQPRRGATGAGGREPILETALI
jgi:hypothetical protein